MKIVDRQTFLQMPSGTLFAKCATPPTYDFGALEIKDYTVGESDFWVQRLIGDFVDTKDTNDWIDAVDALHEGQPKAIDYDVINRDGLFDEDQLFAVLERSDVEALISRLQLALFDGYQI